MLKTFIRDPSLEDLLYNWGSNVYFKKYKGKYNWALSCQQKMIWYMAGCRLIVDEVLATSSGVVSLQYFSVSGR